MLLCCPFIVPHLCSDLHVLLQLLYRHSQPDLHHPHQSYLPSHHDRYAVILTLVPVVPRPWSIDPHNYSHPSGPLHPHQTPNFYPVTPPCHVNFSGSPIRPVLLCSSGLSSRTSPRDTCSSGRPLSPPSVLMSPQRSLWVFAPRQYTVVALLSSSRPARSPTVSCYSDSSTAHKAIVCCSFFFPHFLLCCLLRLSLMRVHVTRVVCVTYAWRDVQCALNERVSE